MKLTVSHKLCGFVFVCLILCPGLAPAYESLVEKKVFTLPSFTTVAGDVLKDVRFGYETYGQLDANKSNAILILPYFSGTGHAAGKFAESDQAPGYWDSIHLDTAEAHRRCLMRMTSLPCSLWIISSTIRRVIRRPKPPGRRPLSARTSAT